MSPFWGVVAAQWQRERAELVRRHEAELQALRAECVATLRAMRADALSAAVAATPSPERTPPTERDTSTVAASVDRSWRPVLAATPSPAAAQGDRVGRPVASPTQSPSQRRTLAVPASTPAPQQQPQQLRANGAGAGGSPATNTRMWEAYVRSCPLSHKGPRARTHFRMGMWCAGAHGRGQGV